VAEKRLFEKLNLDHAQYKLPPALTVVEDFERGWILCLFNFFGYNQKKDRSVKNKQDPVMKSVNLYSTMAQLEYS